jgi:hypothetical protein
VSTLDDVSRIARGLPEVVVADHHGMESFRVRGRIFATVPGQLHVRVMLDEEAIRAAVAEYPTVCEPFWWGKRLACVVVTLAGATNEVLAELLTDAWLAKAPRALRQQWETPG